MKLSEYAGRSRLLPMVAGISLCIFSCVGGKSLNNARQLELQPQQLLLNGDFSKILPATDTYLYWTVSNPEGFTSTGGGLCYSGKTGNKLYQKIDLADVMVPESIIGRVSGEIVKGECRIMVSANFYGPGRYRIRSEALISRSYTGNGKMVDDTFEIKVPACPPDCQLDFIYVFLQFTENSIVKIREVSMTPKVTAATAPSRQILLDGIPLQSIYLPAQSSFWIKKAAMVLQKEVHALTGQALPVYESDLPPPADGVVRFLNPPKLEDAGKSPGEIKEGGFSMEFKKLLVQIQGRDDGYIHAVYALLKESGVEYLSRSEKNVPDMKTLNIKPFSLAKSPRFSLRLAGGPENLCKLGFSSVDMMSCPERLGVRGFDHTHNYFLNYGKHQGEHPEYFAKNANGSPGKFTSISFVHHCLTNPDVLKIYAQNANFLTSLQPQANYIYMTEADGLEWCQCNACTSSDPVKGQYTDRLMDFHNALGKLLSDKTKPRITFAYAGVTDTPPVNSKPDGNLITMLCFYNPHFMCNIHGIDCEYNRAGRELADKWFSRSGNKFMVFDYPGSAWEYLGIFPSTYGIIKNIHYAGDRANVIGYELNGEAAAFNPLQCYLFGKALWNPNIDVEAEIQAYMKKYYGAASQNMLEYFHYLHQMKNHHARVEMYNRAWLTLERSRELFPLMDSALKAVEEGSLFYRRIQREKIFLFWTELNERTRWYYQDKAVSLQSVYADRLAELVRLARREGYTNADHRGPLNEWLWNTAGLRFSGNPWFQDPNVDVFLKNPAGYLNESLNVNVGKLALNEPLPISSWQGIEKKSPPAEGYLRRKGFGTSIMHARFCLNDNARNIPAELLVEGYPVESGVAIDILVNDKCLYSGNLNSLTHETLAGDSFRYKLRIPADLDLCKNSSVVIKNMTQVDENDRQKDIFYRDGTKNPYVAYFTIRKIYFREQEK